MQQHAHARWMSVCVRIFLLTIFLAGTAVAEEANATAGKTPLIGALKVTLLSTMLVGDPTGLGEWGFSALVEADGHRVLVDTGAHPDTGIAERTRPAYRLVEGERGHPYAQSLGPCQRPDDAAKRDDEEESSGAICGVCGARNFL